MSDKSDDIAKSLAGPTQADNEAVYNPVAADDKAGRMMARSKIEAFEQAMKNLFGSERGEMDEINDNGLREYFLDGMYFRELFIPAGVAIVSKLWNRERMWVIAKGEVTFTSELGTQRVEGPITLQAPFGSKVALYAHQDTTWLAIARTNAACSEEVEDDLVAKDYDELTYAWNEAGQEEVA
jgi:hypothetical protein